MKEATITVQPQPTGKCVRFYTTSPVVTITDKRTTINVPPEEVDLRLVYDQHSLDGIKIAEDPGGLLGAPVLGETIGKADTVWREHVLVACLDIKRTQPDTISIIDVGSVAGAWYFQLRLDGTWYDPQIYNKGNEGADRPSPGKPSLSVFYRAFRALRRLWRFGRS